MEIPNFKGELRRDEPLSRHTSYGIGGPADVLACPADREDLRRLLQAIKARQLPSFILGGGTNLLVRDGGFRGVMISLQRMNTIRIEREYHSIGGSFAAVYAEAGASLAGLLSFSMERGLTGLEFAAGIPGTVGGAVCMNAGAALGEMGDVIESVSLISPEGESITMGAEELGFSYRTTSIPEGHLVLDARVVLRHDKTEKIKARIKELLRARKQRQPRGFPNAGSVFKNPREESAGKLIEHAGLKGRNVGGAQVSEKHANVIVNTGKAKATDVLTLMELVKEKVLEVSGVLLEPEIKIIGEDS
jgi:UDP-N-acetylmuramate dehydrogenase